MYLKKFLGLFVGLTVADVVSAAKTRCAPNCVNRFMAAQMLRGHIGNKKIKKNAILPIRSMVWRIVLFHLK